MILRIFLGGLLAVSAVHPQSPSPDNRDRAALIALENEWLANLHNPACSKVRVYGDVGFVNGVVLTTDERGREAERTSFTDVFVRRNGRWEAVNAQENAVSHH